MTSFSSQRSADKNISDLFLADRRSTDHVRRVSLSLSLAVVDSSVFDLESVGLVEVAFRKYVSEYSFQYPSSANYSDILERNKLRAFQESRQSRWSADAVSR